MNYLKFQLEKLGTFGAIIAAILCPICFPKLALLGAVLGLGVLAPFEAWFAVAAQAFLIMSLMGHVLVFRRHRNKLILILAGFGVVLVFASLWVFYIEAAAYLGLVAVVVATIWSLIAVRKCVACESTPPSQLP